MTFTNFNRYFDLDEKINSDWRDYERFKMIQNCIKINIKKSTIKNWKSKIEK
jgi:hypothetical protein